MTRVPWRWTEDGGTLAYGTGNETLCFLMVNTGSANQPSSWPLTIYPIGRCEVVFQHLARRSSFDDFALRDDELRQRLNTIAGVDLPAAKIDLRLSFPLTVLGESEAQGRSPTTSPGSDPVHRHRWATAQQIEG